MSSHICREELHEVLRRGTLVSFLDPSTPFSPFTTARSTELGTGVKSPRKEGKKPSGGWEGTVLSIPCTVTLEVGCRAERVRGSMERHSARSCALATLADKQQICNSCRAEAVTPATLLRSTPPFKWVIRYGSRQVRGDSRGLNDYMTNINCSDYCAKSKATSLWFAALPPTKQVSTDDSSFSR